jgi:hypothetical protein
MGVLVVCVGCQRHVEPSETACPFCGAAVPVRAEPPRAPRGLSRAKLHAFHTAALATSLAAATLAASAESCGGTVAGEDASADAAKDANKSTDSTSDSPFTFPDSQADAETIDVINDFVPPPPYGCVFPSARGCGSVTV